MLCHVISGTGHQAFIRHGLGALQPYPPANFSE
jgi:hypothetical protein